MARVQFGGGGGLGGFSYFPPVIKALLVSNVGIFLAQILLGSFTIGGLPLDYFLQTTGALFPIGDPSFRIWQPVTYMFLHGGLSHVLMNMFALWMFGVEIENTWGSKKFGIYYLLCGLGGAAAHLIMAPILGQEAAPLVGASGAIFGILVAYGLMFPDRMIYFYFFIPMKSKYFVGGYLLLELYSLYSGGGGNISHLAHLGGAVVGIFYLIADAGSGHIMDRLRSDRSSSGSRPGMDAWNPRGSDTGYQVPRAEAKQGGFFRRPKVDDDEPVDAEYYDVGGREQTSTKSQSSVKRGRVITQEEIDRILDKIAASGYQNLSEEEREILFEASRRMDQKR
jgi:membrane associated rhomboid family serine protease